MLPHLASHHRSSIQVETDVVPASWCMASFGAAAGAAESLPQRSRPHARGRRATGLGLAGDTAGRNRSGHGSPLRPTGGRRHWHWNRCRDARSHLRTVLHHQARRRRVWHRSVHGARSGQAARRSHHPRYGAQSGQHISLLLPRCRRAKLRHHRRALSDRDSVSSRPPGELATRG